MSDHKTSTNAKLGAAYQMAVELASHSGGPMMEKMVGAARTALQAREAGIRDFRERDALAISIKLLNSHEAILKANYPEVLLAAFNQPQLTKKPSDFVAKPLQFDQLELMDEVQIQSSVVMARAQQSAVLAAEASLAELNTLVSSAQGLKAVRPEANPLRPEIFVSALKDVVEQLGVPTATQLDWLAVMSTSLGRELKALYSSLADGLRHQGVVPVGYSITAQAGSPVSVRSIDAMAQAESGEASRAVGGSRIATRNTKYGATLAPVSAPDSTLLTLDKLRRLLSGELEDKQLNPPAESFAQQFSRQFEQGQPVQSEGAPDFQATVPAAFEALREMQQVDQVVRRLEQRLPIPTPSSAVESSDGAMLRQDLRSTARGVVQALSLEVMTLMVDNIARDPRLLEPIQAFIRQLEPSLLRLALVDVRLFTDKQHPARVLLQEITHRSLAYETVDSTGFGPFMDALKSSCVPLLRGPIDNSVPFEKVLGALQAIWVTLDESHANANAHAVEVLRHAEQRNVLAEKIAKDISSHGDAAMVPPVVMDFLCGPWAQVVAQARISGGAGSTSADKYQALISALLWSTHPELTRKNIAKLTRLVPLLLATLREGLETIRFPATRTSAFLEALMGLHQLAFRANTTKAESAEPPEQLPIQVSVRANLVEDGNPWVAPEEAKASNFMELPEAAEVASPDQPPQPAALIPDLNLEAPSAQVPAGQADVAVVHDLPLGSWVELKVNDEWVRTQLTWSSPHGTLFLFTSVFGTTQSMTRRSRDRLVALGNLRLISGQPVVDVALDAVAQAALRNSMDISI